MAAFAADVLLKSLVVLLLAALASLGLRRASAAARHLVWLLALGALLALPLLSWVVPKWRVPVPVRASVAPLPSVPTGRPAPASEPPQVKAPPARAAVPAPVPVPRPSPMPAPAPAPAPVVPASPHRVAPTVPVRPAFLLALWLGGVSLLLARTLAGLVSIHRLRCSARTAGHAVTAVAARLSPAMGVRQTVPVLQGTSRAAPMTWGWRHPVILLPPQAGTWSEQRLESVLRHELAHVQRRDWLWQTAAQVVCALYWFHPPVWLAARQLRAEAERACDDCVLMSGIAPSEYGRHLLEIARALQPPRALKGAAVTMAQTKNIETRLRAILAVGHPRKALTARSGAAAALSAACILVAVAMLRPVAQAQGAGSAARAPERSLARTTARATALPAGVPARDAVSANAPRSSSAASGAVIVAGPDGVTLPDGVRVHLDGVGGVVAQGQHWWSPDGTPLPATPSPWPTPAADVASLDAQEPTPERDFAIRIEHPASKYADVACQILPSYRSARTDVLTVPGRAWYEIAAAEPTSAGHCIVRVGVADGVWHDAAVLRASASGEPPPRNNAVLSWAASSITKISLGQRMRTAVTVRDRLSSLNQRIIAIGRDGRTYEGLDCPYTAGEGVTEKTIELPLAPSQIREFRLQTRPQQWIEFRDVALQPHGALPRIKSPADGAPVLLKTWSHGGRSVLRLIADVPVHHGAVITGMRPHLSEASSGQATFAPVQATISAEPAPAPIGRKTDPSSEEVVRLGDATVTNAQQNLDRVRALYNAGATDQAALEDAEQAMRDAKAQLAAAQAARAAAERDQGALQNAQQALARVQARYRAGIADKSELDRAQRALSAAQTHSALTQAQQALDQAQAALVNRQADLDIARQRLARTQQLYRAGAAGAGALQAAQQAVLAAEQQAETQRRAITAAKIGVDALLRGGPSAPPAAKTAR